MMPRQPLQRQNVLLEGRLGLAHVVIVNDCGPAWTSSLGFVLEIGRLLRRLNVGTGD